MIKKTAHKKNRITVGYIASQIYDGLGYALWSSLSETARALDINLICVVGGQKLTQEDLFSKGNIIYQLINIP